MPWSPASPVSGAVVTGLTSPTYTLTPDVAPSSNGKQYAVTVLGGTQSNVDINSVSKPFTISFFRPAQLRGLPQANPTTGIVKNVPMNVYKMITRKGMSPAANQVPLVGRITTTFEIPAGADTYEPEEIRAMISAHIGTLYQQSDGISSTVLIGVL